MSNPRPTRLDLTIAILIAAAIMIYTVAAHGLVGVMAVCGVIVIQQIWYRVKYGHWQR